MKQAAVPQFDDECLRRFQLLLTTGQPIRDLHHTELFVPEIASSAQHCVLDHHASIIELRGGDAGGRAGELQRHGRVRHECRSEDPEQ